MSTATDEPVCSCGRTYSDHTTCRICRRALEHHDDGDVELEWLGAARMATARRDAGQPLDELDRDALARHPRPPVLTRWAGYITPCDSTGQ